MPKEAEIPSAITPSSSAVTFILNFGTEIKVRSRSEFCQTPWIALSLFLRFPSKVQASRIAILPDAIDKSSASGIREGYSILPSFCLSLAESYIKPLHFPLIVFIIQSSINTILYQVSLSSLSILFFLSPLLPLNRMMIIILLVLTLLTICTGNVDDHSSQCNLHNTIDLVVSNNHSFYRPISFLPN